MACEFAHWHRPQRIKELAQIAWDGKLKGDSLKDNSLAKPLDVAFENLALWDEEKETEEEVRAIAAKEIEKAIERIAPKYFGETKKEKIAEFVDVLFDKIYKGIYKSNINEMIERKRRIRAAYLFFVASLIPKKEK